MSSSPSAGVPASLAALLDLMGRARRAQTAAELNFLLLNESRVLTPYRQAALWDHVSDTLSLSGLISVDANVPYAQWVRHVLRHLALTQPNARWIDPSDLPARLREDWAEWWPSHALWVPAPTVTDGPTTFGTIWLRDEPWREVDTKLFNEWLQAWAHAAGALNARLHKRNVWSLPRWRTLWRHHRTRWIAAGALVLLLITPVHLAVLAPGELVPGNPVDMRAPLDGVIGEVLVRPNDSVQVNQVLWTFDRALLTSRLAVAEQALVTALSTYRQTAQKALLDAQVREQLSPLQGQIQERQAQVEYLRDQVQRAEVVAPQAGIALFDDASSLVGKPVQVGERILRIATPGDSEIEGWLSLSDAIELIPGSPVKLFLNARPLEPVQGTLRYVSQEASLRPDGQYAYRVRANLIEPNDGAIGLKGTLKLEGEKVSVLYWVLRRPLASIRTTLGW